MDLYLKVNVFLHILSADIPDVLYLFCAELLDRAGAGAGNVAGCINTLMNGITWSSFLY